MTPTTDEITPSCSKLQNCNSHKHFAAPSSHWRVRAVGARGCTPRCSHNPGAARRCFPAPQDGLWLPPPSGTVAVNCCWPVLPPSREGGGWQPVPPPPPACSSVCRALLMEYIQPRGAGGDQDPLPARLFAETACPAQLRAGVRPARPACGGDADGVFRQLSVAAAPRRYGLPIRCSAAATAPVHIVSLQHRMNRELPSKGQSSLNSASS